MSGTRIFDTDRPVGQRPVAGVCLRLLTALLLAIMFALVKLAATRGVSIVELLFYRQWGAVMCTAGVVAVGPGFSSLRTKRIGAHVRRMTLGMASMALNFTSMVMLPLAEATAIGFSAPIFSTVLAAIVLAEPTGRWRWGAVAAGFVGVLLIVQPGSGGLPLLGASIALVAALVAASLTIVIRQLVATEPVLTTVFWFSLISMVPLGVLLLWFAQAHDPMTWAIVGAVALLGGAAHLALVGSLRLAPVAVVMPMDYTSLIWATMFGALIFGELPTPWTWVGAPIIIISGLVIVWREHRLARRTALAAATASPN